MKVMHVIRPHFVFRQVSGDGCIRLLDFYVSCLARLARLRLTSTARSVRQSSPPDRVPLGSVPCRTSTVSSRVHWALLHLNQHTDTDATKNTQSQTQTQTHNNKHTATNTSTNGQSQTRSQKQSHKHATTDTTATHSHKDTATTHNHSTQPRHTHTQPQRTTTTHNHDTQPQHTTRGSTSKIENHKTHNHGNMLLTVAGRQEIEVSWWGPLQVE